MQTPIPTPRSPARRGIISAAVALVVGTIWSIAQFTISEILYKTSEAELLPYPLSDHAFTLSTLVAWPAEPIYTSVEKRRIEAAIADTLDDKTVPAESHSKLRELVDRGAVDLEHDDHFELYEILDETGVADPSVPVHQEYLIYGGVCVGWGTLVGLIAGLMAWNLQASMARRRHSSPPAL